MKKTVFAMSLAIASIISSSAFAAEAPVAAKQDVKTTVVAHKDAKVAHKHHKKHVVEKKAVKTEKKEAKVSK